MPSSPAVMTRRLPAPPWHRDETLRPLMQAIAGPDETIRIVGGAVRDALLDRPLADIDLATTATPDIVSRRAVAAGFRAIPTGIDHGTMTIVAHGRPYEVTTLRQDVATDGRRAIVAFGRDWAADARRRDFTINALYADYDGAIIDHVGGIADCAARRVRFIGAAGDRIREDYLRILRFFRFHAVIADSRLDADGLAAARDLKAGIDTLSGERIGQEMTKLVKADGAAAAIDDMAAAGILEHATGIAISNGAAFRRLKQMIAALTAAGTEPPAHAETLLLAALADEPDPALALCRRMRLPNIARDRMIAALVARDHLSRDDLAEGFERAVYRLGAGRFIDALLLSAARNELQDPSAALGDLVGRARHFARPQMPVSGRDLLAAGLMAGPEVGRTISALTDAWIDSGFRLTRDDLLARITRSDN